MGILDFFGLNPMLTVTRHVVFKQVLHQQSFEHGHHQDDRQAGQRKPVHSIVDLRGVFYSCFYSTFNALLLNPRYDPSLMSSSCDHYCPVGWVECLLFDNSQVL
jgi:hypothetical protein